MGKKTKIKINKGSEPEVEEEVRNEEPEVSAEEEQPINITEDVIGNLREQLEEEKKKAQENLESWQRERADFSNYKKRIERDQEVSKKSINRMFLKNSSRSLMILNWLMPTVRKTEKRQPGRKELN